MWGRLCCFCFVVCVGSAWVVFRGVYVFGVLFVEVLLCVGDCWISDRVQ